MVRGRSGLVAAGFAVPLLLGAVVACGDDSPSSGPTGAPASGQVDVGGGLPAADPAAVARGEELARTRGCAACHGADGQGGLGPGWVDVMGTEVAFTDGSTAVVDEAYLTRSITEPDAEVVADYAVMMPKTDLSDAEVADLVAYIVSLSG